MLWYVLAHAYALLHHTWIGVLLRVCTRVLLCINLCREEAGRARNVSIADPGNLCVHV